MRVWKFEGATMRDAIAKVKAELGDQAVIISTRQVRRGLLGSAVEISAAIDNDDAEPVGPFSGPTTGGPSTGGPTHGGPTVGSSTVSSHGPAPQRVEQDVEKHLAPLRSEMRSLRALVRTTGESRGTTELRAELAVLRRLIEQLQPGERTAATAATAAEPAPARRATTQTESTRRAATYTEAPPAAPARRAAYTEAPAAYTETPAAPAPRAAQVAQAVHVAQAVQAVQAASARRPAPSYDTPLTASSTGKIIMLVGPTGAGKTTTIAKLAARAALIDNRRTSVITLDNYRVGGIDQIRTFTELIGVPLQVAETPAELHNLIDPASDLTLIDTAGRSPRDRAAIEEIARQIEGLDIEVHLVIPAAATAPQIDELVQRYAALRPVRLLFTKLDECDHAPELALAPPRTRLPITWVTTGQAVPEDIEQPSSARVLELASTGIYNVAASRNHSHRAA